MSAAFRSATSEESSRRSTAARPAPFFTQRGIARWRNRDRPGFPNGTPRTSVLGGHGKVIARRNLFWSILAENLGFSVWLIWSIVATRLPQGRLPLHDRAAVSLVAVPGLVGSLMRFPYTFAVPKFGGRNWTIVSALLLFVPTTSPGVARHAPRDAVLADGARAATAGLGGGNFASSMANISFFYPDREKGFALGLNAAGGNIGVSTVQLLDPDRAREPLVQPLPRRSPHELRAHLPPERGAVSGCR